eukprot:3168018-Rhodomonas_salina.1
MQEPRQRQRLKGALARGGGEGNSWRARWLRDMRVAIRLCVCLSVWVSLSACMPISLSACLPVCLSVPLPICLSVGLYVYQPEVARRDLASFAA